MKNIAAITKHPINEFPNFAASFKASMKVPKILWFLPAILLIQSCARKPFLPPAPAATYAGTVASVKEVSTLNIPIEIPLSEISRKINEQLGLVLFEDNSLEDNGGDNLMLKVTKREPIALDGKGGNLFAIRVPLKIWAKAGYKVEKFGVSVSKYEDTEFDIDMDFLTRINLNSDWKVSTSTVSNGYKWVSEPKVKIGFFSIPVTGIIEKIIERELPQVVKTVDGEVAKISFRQQVESVWKSVQNPILMNQTYQAWLKVSPQSIVMTPIGMKGNNVRVGLGINTLAETFMGAKPAASALIPLPVLKINEKMEEKFEVGLMTEIPFSQMKKIAMEQAGGKTYEFNDGKQKITVLDMEIYGHGDDLVVGTTLSGALNGKVFIKGKPYYDAASQSLKMKDLDYDLETKNGLLKTADWLAHGKFLKMMEPHFSIPVSAQLEEARKMIRENLTGDAMNKMVKLNGSLSELRPGAMFVRPEGIRAIIYAKGKLEVKVAGF